MSFFQKLNYCFTKREKVRALRLVFLMFIGGISEAIGIGLIVPYIALINNSEFIEKNKYISALYRYFHFTSHQSFIFYCGIAFFFIYLFKNIYTYLLIRAQNKFVYDKEVSLSRSLLWAYLKQPYTFHLQKNSAELINNLGRTSHMFQGVLIPLITITIESIVVLSVVVVLILVRPVPALLATVALGVSTLLFYVKVRMRVRRAGQAGHMFSEKITKSLHQSLGGIKETKILGREEFFVTEYADNLRGYVDTISYIAKASQTPRLGLEVFAVLGIVSAVCITGYQGKNLQELVPTLGLFGLAVVRLMPSLNRILSNLALMRASADSVEVVYRDLQEFPELLQDSNVKILQTVPKLTFSDSIQIRNLTYKYPGSRDFALAGINVVIPKNTSVAFIGPSGAGKSTLVDLILGLLEPTAGDVLIDHSSIKLVKGSWQRNVGYIPQTIYLTDDSVRANIAFGVPVDEIDDGQVWEALKAARLEEYVKSTPDGLNTFVGERGVRISGGQRQRIGIARALYHNPAVLVLDEATSALDQETEREVAAALDNLNGKKTMIIIAHRLTTVEKCDQIFKIAAGKVVATGTYKEICLGL